ncbi:MAG TPA: ABC transporter permease [Longimicrobiales bacterium]
MRIESFREGALLALDQLRANKFRSALTILGVVVGVATVMAMSALIAGIRASIMEDIEAAGPRNFAVARFDDNEVRLTGDNQELWARPRITLEEVDRIARLDAVRSAIVGFDLTLEVDAGREKVENVQVLARGAGWSQFTPGTIVAGHDFLEPDVRGARPVVLLSRPLAEALFGPLDPIGRRVRIRGRSFEVIGIFENGRNIFANIVKHVAIVPYTAAIKHLSASPDWMHVFVVTAPHATQAEAIDQVITTLRVARGLRPGEPNNFAIIRQEEMIRSFNRLTGAFFVIMIALSSVGLMVGGVGVIAIMMIAVTERTREIGIRKALGATQREILWQFLFEAATLTLIGGAIGMLAGGGLAFVVQAVTPIPARVPLPAIAAALGMAAVAGIGFGLWPAWRAARLDPVVALRHE